MKILAIDYGTKRVGVAIGDSELKIAKPLCVLKNDKHVLDHIKKLIKEYSIERIVLGNPLKPSGGKSKMSEAVEEFADYLRNEMKGIDIILWDERYTSEEAEEYLRGLSPNKKRELKDKISAFIILKDYMGAM